MPEMSERDILLTFKGFDASSSSSESRPMKVPLNLLDSH